MIEINENTTAKDIDPVQTVREVYQSNAFPSLCEEILGVVPLSSTSVFNFSTYFDDDKVGLLRTPFVLNDAQPISLDVTIEALQDLHKMSNQSYSVIVRSLKNKTNIIENKLFLEFLDTNADVAPDISLSNSSEDVFNIVEHLNNLVFMANSVSRRSLGAWAILPFQICSKLMAHSLLMSGVKINNAVDDICSDYGVNLDFGNLKIYSNPDVTATDSYLALGKKYSPYNSVSFGRFYINVFEGVSPETGQPTIFVIDKFGFALNANNLSNKSIFKFKVQ